MLQLELVGPLPPFRPFFGFAHETVQQRQPSRINAPFAHYGNCS
jgi:hypothetical protein